MHFWSLIWGDTIIWYNMCIYICAWWVRWGLGGQGAGDLELGWGWGVFGVRVVGTNKWSCAVEKENRAKWAQDSWRYYPDICVLSTSIIWVCLKIGYLANPVIYHNVRIKKWCLGVIPHFQTHPYGCRCISGQKGLGVLRCLKLFWPCWRYLVITAGAEPSLSTQHHAKILI